MFVYISMRSNWDLSLSIVHHKFVIKNFENSQFHSILKPIEPTINFIISKGNKNPFNSSNKANKQNLKLKLYIKVES